MAYNGSGGNGSVFNGIWDDCKGGRRTSEEC